MAVPFTMNLSLVWVDRDREKLTRKLIFDDVLKGSMEDFRRIRMSQVLGTKLSKG